MKSRKTNKIVLLVVSFVLLICFCLPFFGGFFSPEQYLEGVAQATSQIVKENTINSKYLTITVAETENSGAIQDPYSEFYKLYGTFRQEQVSFGSGINFYDESKNDKEHNIFLNDYNGNNISANLSMFYLGPVGSVEYNGHNKHYVYPFELMFIDDRNYDISRYLAYISESHANKLLESLGEQKDETGKYTTNQYESLIRKKVNMYIDGEIYEYVINNIYFQNNYYYEAIHETFSDFILTSYFSPNKNALIRERKNIYFMNNYAYQNQYYMEYINKTYSSKLFDVSINKNNVTKVFDDQKVLDFYYLSPSNQYDGLFIFFVITYYLLLIVCLVLLILFRFSFSLLPSISLGVCAFTPYFVFWIIFEQTKSVALFTKMAGINYFIGVTIMAITFIVWSFINGYVLGKRKKV